jgi:hypothetical protein
VRATLAVVVAALCVPAVAAAYANFRAPGRTLYCEIGDPPPPRVLQCWRATDGRSIAVLPTGRAVVNPDTNTKGLHQDRAPVLQFGQTWHRLAYRCTSRRLGVTCTNGSGHGFWLGRYKGYRLL